VDLAPFHTLIVTLHVLGVLLFVLAHGVSAFVLLRIRAERDPVALRTLLGLSRGSFGVMSVGFLISSRVSLPASQATGGPAGRTGSGFRSASPLC
jgi:hypothetical protein